MPSDKKITKEDTWRPADLRRHIREDDHGDDRARRRDDTDRKHRGGGSIERRHREPEESRRDRDKLRESESTRVREDEDGKERYSERRKEGSQSRKRDKDKERNDEMDTEKRRLPDDDREKKERRRERHENREREREKDRHKDKEKEMERDKKRHTAEDRDKRWEDKDKERRREEWDREHRSDTRRLEESGEGIRDPTRRKHREHSDRRHRKDEDKKKDRDLQERQEDGKHSQRKEDKEYKEERRRRKEERERRHKERGHPDEIRKHENESREHLDFRQTGEELRRSHGDRDREERDKHRERRKKVENDAETKYKERKQKEEEAEDVERNLRDTTSSKKSSDKSHKHEKKDIVAEGFKDEDLAEEEYEDDFEDYEEDFEEMDESTDEAEKELLDSNVDYGEEKLTTQQKKEIEAIKRAMAEENERAGTAQSRPSTNREEEDTQRTPKGSEKNESTSSQRGKFIDFVTAKQREVSKKVASKQKKRSTELLRLIDLDFSTTACLLDLPPISEYELYIRSFGNANTKQAYVQCNEDNVERDIQTEEIEISDKWTQHPPERSGACGDPNVSQDKSRSDLNIDSKRLISFLHSASQVMVVLLEEDQAERNSQRKLKTQTDSLSFSGGSLELNTNLPFLYGRRVSLVHFSEVQRHTMMSVHMPTVQPSAVRLDSCTIICIWNIWERSRPQKILIYESAVQCCCFSPGKATLVFAGTSVGSVVLWDLREYASDHYHLKIGEDEWTFRHPTFSTDAVMAATGHYSPVTAVEVVPSIVTGGLSVEVPFLVSEEESSGLSFQLASLDESGLINFWVVVELPKGNEAGSPADLGLRPGGKVKLLHSSSLLAAERVSPRDAAKKRALQTQLLKFLPTDSNHFFVGTNLGLVNHGTSHGLKAPPKFYRFQEVEVRPVNVTSIHFSPFKPHLFLVGCEDGSIRLHAVSHEQPVAEWRNSTAGEPVVSLQWSLTRSAVFCVLDATSNLHIWDLLKGDVQPVVTERISADRVTTMAVFGDSGKKITFSGVALAHESGKIELHFFTNNLTVSSSAEEEKLDSLLTEAF